jgi:hypothetical protein
MGLFSAIGVEKKKEKEEVEEEEWVIKITHRTTLGIKSSSTNVFWVITIEKKNEDEERKKKTRICKFG